MRLMALVAGFLFCGAATGMTSCGDDGSGGAGGDTDSDTDTDSDSDTDTGFLTEPEAVEAFDESSGGIYKGVLVGSSGHFKVVLDNGEGELFVYIKFDGEEATLYTGDLDAWQPGDAIIGAEFTGTLDGQDVTFTFSVDADGSNPIVEVSVPGHEVWVDVVKETSTDLVKCYEGESWTGETLVSVWNMLISGVSGSGVWVAPTDLDVVWGTCEFGLDGDTFTDGLSYMSGEGDPIVTFGGAIDGNDVSGTWEDIVPDGEDHNSGTFAGTRVL